MESTRRQRYDLQLQSVYHLNRQYLPCKQELFQQQTVRLIFSPAYLIFQFVECMSKCEGWEGIQLGVYVSIERGKTSRLHNVALNEDKCEQSSLASWISHVPSNDCKLHKLGFTQTTPFIAYHSKPISLRDDIKAFDVSHVWQSTFGFDANAATRSP